MSTKHICSQKAFWRKMQNTLKTIHLSVLKTHVLNGFSIKKKTEKEMIIKHNFSNPLLAACREGDLNVIKELIKARADINMQDAVLQKC